MAPDSSRAPARRRQYRPGPSAANHGYKPSPAHRCDSCQYVYLQPRDIPDLLSEHSVHQPILQLAVVGYPDGPRLAVITIDGMFGFRKRETREAPASEGVLWVKDQRHQFSEGVLVSFRPFSQQSGYVVGWTT